MIGTALCEHLHLRGDEVMPVDRAPNIWNPRVNADTRRIDLLDPPEGYDLPRAGVDVVVHCAAHARVHDLVVDPLRAFENIQTCAHALEFARRAGAHFIFTSSREVYGNQEAGTFSEEQATLAHVESPYAASKLAGEALVQSYQRVYGMPATVVRLSNVYGRYDLSDRFIPTCARAALFGSTLTIYGREKRLDFTYLDDVIAGLMAVVKRGSRGVGEVINIASGWATSLQAAAQIFGHAFDREMTIEVEPSRPGEVVSFEADISKAARLLGYRPSHTLHTASPLAAQWYRQQLERGP
jgi:UDP-glucose 4-epimerase